MLIKLPCIKCGLKVIAEVTDERFTFAECAEHSNHFLNIYTGQAVPVPRAVGYRGTGKKLTRVLLKTQIEITFSPAATESQGITCYVETLELEAAE